MKRYIRLALGIVCSIAIATPAWAQPRAWAGETTEGVRWIDVTPASSPARALERSLIIPPTRRTEGNAAPVYHQALLLLASLSHDEQTELEEISRIDVANVNATRGDRLMGRTGPAIELVDLATRMERCEWGTQLKERGAGVILPEAGYLRLLGVIIAAKARLEIFRGERDKGLKTIAMGLALARHVAQGPTIMQGVIGLSIADRMADQLEAYLWTRGAPSLYWALVELGDKPVNIDAGVRDERFIFNYEVESIEEIDAGRVPPETAIAAMTRLLDPDRPPHHPAAGGWRAAAAAAAAYPAARRAFLARGMPAKEIDLLPVTYVSMRYHLARYLELRDELFKWMSLPYSESRAGLLRAQEEVERAKARGEGGALLQMIPDLAGLARTQARVQRRFAMLRTIESLRLHAATHSGEFPTTLQGLGAAPPPVDPVAGRAFTYRVENGVAVLVGESPAPARAGAPERMEYRLRLVGGTDGK